LRSRARPHILWGITGGKEKYFAPGNKKSYHTRLMPRFSHITLLLPLLILLSLHGCAGMGKPGPEETQWDLSPKAQATLHFLQFEQARRDQRTQEAEESLRKLLDLGPSPQIYIEAANYYWREGKIFEARQMLKEGIQSYPESRRLHLTLAKSYLAEKRREDAEITLRGYLAKKPKDWEVRRELAVILTSEKKFAQALDVLEPIPEDERSPLILFHWAKAGAGLGLNRQAIEKLKKAVEKSPNFVEAWAELAYLYEVEKDFVSAESTYAHILEMGNAGREVWLRQINLNLKLNNPDKALSLFRQGPEDLDFTLEAATVFMDEEFFDQARAVLEPLAKQEDIPERVFFYLAVLAFEGDKDPVRALELLKKINLDDPHYDRAFKFRIHLLIETGQREEALGLIAKGKKSFPNQSDFWLLEAGIYEGEKNFPLARKALESALEKWPKDTEILYSLGIVLERMELPGQGLAIMEKIISLDPEHADALNYVGYTLADKKTDLDRALVLIQRALELKPQSGYILDSLAWVLFQRGSLAKAWEEMQKAVEKAPDDPIIWEHYGDIARALEDKDKAREGYRKSLEIKPGNTDVEQKLKAL